MVTSRISTALPRKLNRSSKLVRLSHQKFQKWPGPLPNDPLSPCSWFSEWSKNTTFNTVVGYFGEKLKLILKVHVCNITSYNEKRRNFGIIYYATRKLSSTSFSGPSPTHRLSLENNTHKPFKKIWQF